MKRMAVEKPMMFRDAPGVVYSIVCAIIIIIIIMIN